LVASLGIATTDEHLNRLFRLCDNVAFCFDGDRAGKKAAWRALEPTLPHIREGRQVRFAFLPDGHDPDSYVNEYGADAFIKVLDEGVALSDYLIGELAGQVDLDTVDGRARLAELAKPLLLKVPAGVYKDLLMASLAERVGLSAEKLARSIGQNDDGPAQNRPTTSLGRKIAAFSGKPSVVRRSITLLLNHPEAGGNLDVEKLAGLGRPGIELLQRLIETVQEDPNITTAGLLERWRHDDEGRHLGKLAAVEIPSGEDFDPAAELHECLEQLAAAGRRKRVDLLIEKQRVNNLSDEERAELRQLS